MKPHAQIRCVTLALLVFSILNFHPATACAQANAYSPPASPVTDVRDFPNIANAYSPPASPRVTYNFNPGWKFIRQDVPGADNPAFDDSSWTNVSLPHTWNDTDSYRALISHGGGD